MKFSVSIIFLFLLVSCSKTKSEQEKAMSDIISVSEVAVPYYQKNYKTLNVNGNVKEIFCTDYVQFVPNSDFHTYIVKENYKFDSLGNIIEEIGLLENDKFKYRHVYTYDKMNNALKKQRFNEANELITEKKDSLNKQGLFISSYYYHRFEGVTNNLKKYKIISDTIINSTLYTIQKGVIKDSLKEIKQFEDGNLIYWLGSTEHKYKYDKNGNQIFQWLKHGLDTLVYHMEYDENNREIKWNVQRKGKIRNEILKSYDEFGNIIKRVFHDDKGEINDKPSYYDILTYDSQNNWIKRERFRLNGSKISVLERRITYY